MNRDLFIKISLTGIILIIIFVAISDGFTRTGNEIVATAQTYLNHSWICNSWNARPRNNDGDPETNDYDYPFWPAGEPYKEKLNDHRLKVGGFQK